MTSPWSSTALADHHTVSASPLMVEFDLASAASRYTPVEDFFVRTHSDLPQPSQTAALRLQEGGKTRILTPEVLHRLPLRTIGATLECAGNGVGNGGVSNGLWQGWAFADLFHEAEMGASARWVHLRGRDGYVRSVAAEHVWKDGFLMVALDHRPIPLRHGSPWRALLRGWYGMDSVKWLETIEFGDQPLSGNSSRYMELTRSAGGAVVKSPLPRMMVKSVIIAPAAGAVLQRGAVELRGLAWSGSGAIAAVDLRTDENPQWSPARLEAGGRDEWIFWRWSTRLSERGAVVFTCRARDASGAIQPLNRNDNRLDGYANNWCHRVQYVVV